MEIESEKPKGHTRVQWAVVLAVNTTLFTYGLQCGWVSPVAKILQSEESPVGRPLTNLELSLIAGAPPVSAVFAIPSLVYIVDNFGRRWCILLIAVSQLLCWVITICPSNFASLLVARLFSGFGAGGCYHVVPMYIKEISQDNIRGALGAICTVFQNLGILAVYCLGGYLDYYKMLYVMVSIPMLTILTFFKAPESPSYLVKTGKTEVRSSVIISYLRGLTPDDKIVQNEIDSLKREDAHFKSIPNISFVKIFKVKEWRRGFFILFWICVMRALNGCFAIIQYASKLLTNSELNINPVLQSLGIPIFMTIGALVTMAVVDKLGRKLLLAINFAITMVTFLGLATSIVLSDHGWSTPGWLTIVGLLLALYCYGGGVSPIPFIVMSEIFNFQIRAKLMACLSILSWFLGFIQIILFDAITNAFGVHTTFFICGTVNILGTIITAVFLPETGNRSVEQIECELNKKKIVQKGVNE